MYMMESLTGYFILQGLLFDIIGVTIVIKGLFTIQKFVSKASSERMNVMRNYSNRVANQNMTLENIGNRLRVDIELRKKLSNEQLSMAERITLSSEFETLTENTTSLFNKMMDASQEDKIMSQIESIEEQQKQAYGYGMKGLPYLIGGFLLQGIGVFAQLY